MQTTEQKKQEETKTTRCEKCGVQFRQKYAWNTDRYCSGRCRRRDQDEYPR